MLNDEQAGRIVLDCIRATSHIDTVVSAGSLDAAEISNQSRVNDLIRLIVTDDEIGVPSQHYAIDVSDFQNVHPETNVNTLINIVRDRSVAMGPSSPLGGDSTTGSDRYK